MNWLIRRGLSVVPVTCLVAAALAFPSYSHARAANLSVLDNGTIRVGVDPQHGGDISYLSSSHGANVENLLVVSQQSYWGGPFLPDWIQWHGWPAGFPAVASSNDGKTIYTKVLNPDCECALETWIRLEGNAVRVHNRLKNFRSDTTPYPAAWSELPALYAAGSNYRVVAYDGEAPFMHAPVRDVTDLAHFPIYAAPNYGIEATEHWAALVNDDNFGVGLFEPGLDQIASRSTCSNCWPGGYLAGVREERLDANIVYSYDYTLVVGSVSRIRAFAYAHRTVPRPRYLFKTDRQHFLEWNASDFGLPMAGALRMRVDQNDPQLVGPTTLWLAAQVRQIYIRGAWHTRQGTAQLFWGTGNGYPFSGDRVSTFAVQADGRFHSYRVRLWGLSGYRGAITRLRLDPVSSAEPGGWVDVTCISWKPCPVDRRAERGLLANDRVPFLDRFDSDELDTRFWSVAGNSSQTDLAQRDGELEITVPDDAAPLRGQDYVGAGIYSRCSLVGDFDTQVDYRLLNWPENNGVNVNFGIPSGGLFRHNFSGGDGVSTYFSSVGSPFVRLDDPVGSFRLVRKGGTVTAFYRRAGEWVPVDVVKSAQTRFWVGLSIYTNTTQFSKQYVRVAFDNFRVNQGRLSCPAG
jgi:hypothetical protein